MNLTLKQTLAEKIKKVYLRQYLKTAVISSRTLRYRTRLVFEISR